MFIRTTMPVRMSIAALLGVLTVGAWGTFALSLFGWLFEGQSNPTVIALGLTMLVSGPILLGLTNAPLPRALLAGLLAPVAALAVSGAWSVCLSILEPLLSPLSVGTATTLAAVNAATLVGTTELLSRRPFKTEVAHVLRGVGLALLIAFGLELLRSVMAIAALAGPISQTGSKSWLVIGVYAVTVGANTVYFEGNHRAADDRSSILAAGIFLGLNFLGLVIIVATMLVA